MVAFGRSLQDSDGYYLIRAYESRDELQASQSAFYGSREWRDGPREEILSLIENYMNAAMSVTREAVDAMRQSHGSLAAIEQL